MCAYVAKKYHLMPWEVRKLTLPQLSNIIFHEEDGHGELVPVYDAKPVTMSDEDKVRAGWISQGISPTLCDLKWREFLEEEGERYRLEQLRLPHEEIDRRVAEFRKTILAKRGPAW